MKRSLEVLREIWALNHALESASMRMHATMGVTAQQRMVLRFIGENPSITAGELSELLHVGEATVSTALKRLIERGLVLRHRDKVDKRRMMLVLTAAGKKLDVPTNGTVESAVSAALEEATPEGVEAIRAFLQRSAELLVRPS